jgi:hypothetical protein
MRRLRGHQASYPLDEGRRRLTAGQAGPVDVSEPIGDVFVVLAGIVDNHRKQERLVGRHQVGPVDRELPLQTEIPLVALVGVSRDDRDE